MKYKYSPFENLAETIPVSYDDLVSSVFKELPKPKVISVYGQNIRHPMITKFSLAAFGLRLLQDSQKLEIAPYLLSIPARRTLGGTHMVAMLLDNKSKEILYQDSIFPDMTQEVEDFLRHLFTEYTVYVIKEQRQGLEKDNSCLAMAAYNLRDMLYEKYGLRHKISRFNSDQARRDLFEQVKNIPEPKQDVEKQKLSLKSIKIISSIPDIEAKQKESFEYKMYNQKDYKEQVDWAVKTATESLQMFQK